MLEGRLDWARRRWFRFVWVVALTSRQSYGEYYNKDNDDNSNNDTYDYFLLFRRSLGILVFVLVAYKKFLIFRFAHFIIEYKKIFYKLLLHTQ